MSAVEIVPVKTRADRKRFLLLPWKLYAGDPNWIPPLRMNQEELLGFRKHPFYENAEAQAFLAVSGKEVVGRIHAIIDHGHNSYYSEKRGFFGFFESTNSDEVAGGSFRRGEGVAR